MAKGYWIAHVTVTNPEEYQKYVNASAIAFKKFGVNILARGGTVEHLEGDNGRPRNVVIEFASLQDAHDCYNSDEYQTAKTYRKDAGIADILIVEGV